MKRILLVIVLILNITVLPGCANKNEINDTVAVIAHGWDWDAENQKKVLSAQIALTQPGGDSFAVVSQGRDTLAQADRRYSLFLPRLPIWSLANTIVIGEELARYDMQLVTDAALRNPKPRPNTYLFVSTGSSAQKILNVDISSEQHPATALAKLIRNQQNQVNIYTPVRLIDFLYKSATAGIEPTIPQIVVYKKNGKEYLRLQGTAVFKGSKMVGSLSENESTGLRLLSPRVTQAGIFDIKINENNGITDIHHTVSLEILRSTAKFKPIIKANKIVMKIDVKADGNIVEQNCGMDSTDPDATKMFEYQAEKVLKRNMKACINRAQALESDILGWGLLISRNNPRAWKTMEDNWPHIFSQIEYDIQVDFLIRRSYLVQEPLVFKN